MTVPRPPAFDGQTFGDTLDKHLRKPDGTPYAVWEQFKPWKVWNDKLRDFVESNRRAIVDHKKHIDNNTARISTLEQKVTALEDAPSVPFPASG